MSSIQNANKEKSISLNFIRSMKQLALFLTIPIFLSSCVKYKQMVYFREAPNNLQSAQITAVPKPVHLIQPDDQLSITIYSIDPLSVAPLNLSVSNPTVNSNGEVNMLGVGYLVDRDGNIDMPVLGRVHAAGLSVIQLKDEIINRSLKYVKDPIVNIRFLNFRFTVLGEVMHPGTFSIPHENITLLQALGIAGDITAYGNKQHVLVIREVNGQQEFSYINLLSQDVFSSPLFYLQKNDQIIVEPIEAKTASIADPATKILPYLSFIVTLSTLVITLIRTN